MDVAVLLLLTAVVALSRHVNVAASCGVAALPGRPCGRALAGSGSAATTAGAVMVCSPESNGSQGLGALPGSGSGSGGQTDFGPALRTSAPGRTGSPAAVMAPGSSGNGSGTSSSEPRPAVPGPRSRATPCSSARSAPHRCSAADLRGVRSILRRDEDRRGFCIVDGGRWLREGCHRHIPRLRCRTDVLAQTPPGHCSPPRPGACRNRQALGRSTSRLVRRTSYRLRLEVPAKA
jgi:hypothetical protein